MGDDARLFDNADAFAQPFETTVYCGVAAALESFRIAAKILHEEDSKQR